MAALDALRRRQRVQFFFDDYVDTGSRLLEIGPGDGWLGPYLVHAGFLGYRRFDAAPPADHVGELVAWRAAGIAPASQDIVIAFDVVDFPSGFEVCRDILKPGGFLFLTAPRPERAALRRLLERLGLRRALPPPGRHPAALGEARGFQIVAARERWLVERWARLRKPVDPAAVLAGGGAR